MQVVISNKSKLNIGEVTVNPNNHIAKVNFSKVAKVGTITLADISDVIIPNTIDNGAVLTYNASNNFFIMENAIDGGEF